MTVPYKTRSKGPQLHFTSLDRHQHDHLQVVLEKLPPSTSIFPSHSLDIPRVYQHIFHLPIRHPLLPSAIMAMPSMTAREMEIVTAVFVHMKSDVCTCYLFIHLYASTDTMARWTGRPSLR